MGEGGRCKEVEEKEKERKTLLSHVFLFFFPAYESSEERPCWVERRAFLSFKSHSLSQFPLRTSQRDQQRRESEKWRRRREETGSRHAKKQGKGEGRTDETGDELKTRKWDVKQQ